METKQAHTPGALRAAKRFMLEFRNDPDSPMAYTVAEIISRETRDADMLEALQAVLNDMRRMSSPSLLTLGKVISAIQQACEHDWRGVDWGRMCFKCGKEDRQV